MRINAYIARATGLSRRAADKAIVDQRVRINGEPARTGVHVADSDKVALDGRAITPAVESLTIMLNKPTGYVCSRHGQGSPTIYKLLPAQYRHLKTVGRLDKDSSGLLLLTDDGQLANRLTHPRYGKSKVYEITLDKLLVTSDQQAIEQGIQLEDGPSRLQLQPLDKTRESWQVTMTEGRNRQIRRTFAARGYSIARLHRTRFGGYSLRTLKSGSFTAV